MSTDFPDGSIQCSCGRTFAQLNAHTNHQRTCKKRKKNLSSALAKAKLTWDNRKRRRTDDSLGEPSGHSGTSVIPNPPDASHVSCNPFQGDGLELSHHEINSQNVSAINEFSGFTGDDTRCRPRLLIHRFQWNKQSLQSLQTMTRQSEMI